MCEEAVCENCRTPWNFSRERCELCGHNVASITRLFEEGVLGTDSMLYVTARDDENNILAESVSISGDKPIASAYGNDKSDTVISTNSLSVTEDNVAEEGQVVDRFLAAYNKKCGSNLFALPKSSEDGDYFDRALSEGLGAQVRNLDDKARAELGKSGKFEGGFDHFTLMSFVQRAINAKAKVDQQLKTKTFLLLFTHYPLPSLARKRLERESFNLNGFKSIWICPYQSDCFEVHSEISEADLKVAAYYLWESAGKLYGDELKHWFSAIEKTRGLDS